VSVYCTKHPEKEGTFYCAKYNRYLCEDCLACQDPTIYCKHRTSCLIWEFVRHGVPGEDREARRLAKSEKAAPVKIEEGKDVTIKFLPCEKEATVKTGTTLLEAAREADVYINARCNGEGVCGKCKVIVEQGEFTREPSIFLKDNEVDDGYVLACTTTVENDMVIRNLSSDEKRRLSIVQSGEGLRQSDLGDHEISPLVRKVRVKMTPPSLDDPSSDYNRLTRALAQQGENTELLRCSLKALRELAKTVRQSDWDVDVVLLDRRGGSELISTLPTDNGRSIYGIAVDVGTTSVVAYLVDLADGEVIAVSSTQNAQVACGEDVISRIICAKGDDGIKRLNRYVIETVNELIAEVCQVAKVDKNRILSGVFSGNTVMIHSLLKLDPGNIRMEPYVPIAISFPLFSAEGLGLDIHPLAGIYNIPGNAAYVGGDITSGIVYAGISSSPEMTLFIDVGTNGEMVLGNSDFLMTAACSAGPAFEGGGIRHGMRAITGAIDSVKIDRKTRELTFTTIDDEKPIGICGSGMIDLLAELFLNGILGQGGKFAEASTDDRIREGDTGPEFVIVRAEDSDLDEDIVFSEVDIDNIIRSKAAIYGGIETLLAQSGIPIEAIDRFLVAGGFGRHLNIERSIQIGLFPDIDPAKYQYLGNSSVKGAYLALMNAETRQELSKASGNMTYIDFSSSNLFFDAYQSAMFLPHTNIKAFPTVEKLMDQ
jgi:uncharacterized 2Fe-2S/4Fe-4S cluster protein (DUF4445 family)